MSPKKRQVNDTDTRARILAAATEVFATIGFAGARVDDIAERAGINKAMLYYHVGDKERLYTTVLTDTVERAYASLQAATEQADTPSAKLECLLDTFAEIGSSNPHFVPIMLREIASGGATLPDEMLLRMTKVFRVVADILAEGTRKGAFRKTDPLLTHVTLIGATMFLIASQPIRERLAKVAGLDHRHSLQELADHTYNLMLHGLEKKPGAAKPRSRK